MTLLVEIMIGVAERVARGLVFLSVIEPSARPPGRAARQIMGAAARQLKDKLRAGAWATGSTGTGHLAPPIINSYLFLTRSPLNLRFFREASDAARWLAPYTEQFTDQDILRQCSEMKLRIDRHAGG
ncbi:MAG TPA: hypothetical protein VHM19_15425 [Polyangiales bacterium]|nr:hypothetical protein [Polyangiales bacterium]